MFIDRTGQKFGRWTVIERVYGYRTRWRCRCDCGRISVIFSENLVSGASKSCGCLKREIARETIQKIPRRKQTRRGFVGALMGTYRAAARRRRQPVPFSLSRVECTTLFFSDCFYCGRKPSGKLSTTSGVYKRWRYNGIDRLDPSRGYVTDNVVTACKDCNYAKASRTRRQFRVWIQRTYHHMFV